MTIAANSNDAPIVVVGAGVVGLSIAFRLAQQFPNVLLIDRNEPGMACSYGNAGHIATEQLFPLASPATLFKAPRLMLSRNRPLSIRPAYGLRILPWLMRFAWASRPSAFGRGTAALTSLQTRAVASLESLCADAGVPSELHRRGHMILVENPRLRDAAIAQRQMMADHGIATDWLKPAQVARRAPELTRNAGAIYARDTAHVGDPLRLSRGLLEAFANAGGRLRRDDVERIDPTTDGGVRLKLSAGPLDAQRVVIAAGAWSRPLAAQTGYDVPLDTERGYHVVAKNWRGSFDFAIASFDRMTIMTPLDGGLRITGFVEFGGLELPPTQARLKTLHRHLGELLPSTSMPDRSEWMGFRPSLPDHLPVIGQSPRNPNLYYAFGHQHLGLTLAGITADIIGSLAAGGQADIDLAPFRIDRF